MRPRQAGRAGGGRPRGAPGAERAWAIALLAVHAALALWGAAMNSVTFDENFHVPAGAFIAARRDFEVSFAQPPLAKTLCALPALALGAKLPPDSLVPHGPAEIAEGPAGEAFMRINAGRFHALYFAARCVAVLFSLALGWLVWRFAHRLHGPRGALLALALYAFAPEAIAHAGIAGVDVATGLAITAAVYAFWRFARTTRWRDAAVLALVTGLAFLTRFSAIQLAPTFVLLAALGMGFGRLRRPGRVWLVLALLPVTTLVIFNLGYLGQTSFAPLGRRALFSPRLRALQQAWPTFRPPVPDAALRGLDYLSYLSQTPERPTYLLGAIRTDSPWTYFPIALAVKWPLGFLGALGLYAALRLRKRPGRKRLWNECVLLVPVAVVLGSAMVAQLNVGIRYVFPILPLLCVWCGGLLGRDALPATKRAAATPAVRREAAVPAPGGRRARIGMGPGRGDRPCGAPGGGERERLAVAALVLQPLRGRARRGLPRRERLERRLGPGPHRAARRAEAARHRQDPPRLSRHHRPRDLRDRLHPLSGRHARARERLDRDQQLLLRQSPPAHDDAAGTHRASPARLPPAVGPEARRRRRGLHVPVPAEVSRRVPAGTCAVCDARRVDRNLS